MSWTTWLLGGSNLARMHAAGAMKVDPEADGEQIGAPLSGTGGARIRDLPLIQRSWQVERLNTGGFV